MIDIDSESDYMQDINENQAIIFGENKQHIYQRFFTFNYKAESFECGFEVKYDKQAIAIGVRKINGSDFKGVKMALDPSYDPYDHRDYNYFIGGQNFKTQIRCEDNARSIIDQFQGSCTRGFEELNYPMRGSCI